MSNIPNTGSRRGFLTKSGLAAAALAMPQVARAQNTGGEKLRIGFIGCGGRSNNVGEMAKQHHLCKSFVLAATVAVGVTACAVSASAETVVLSNVAAKVDFDLGRGVYSLTMPSAMPAIRDAHASAEGWDSTDAGYKRRVIGKTADRMLVECVKGDAPTLLLEFTLHPEFIEMRTGVRNTTAAPIRIRKFRPLAGCIVFPEGKWSHARTLTATTAGNDPKVVKTVFAKSANNLLLTLKQDGGRRSLVIGALKTA